MTKKTDNQMLIANTLIGVGLAIIAVVGGYALDDPMPLEGLSVGLFAGGLFVVVGTIKRQADRLIAANTYQSMALMRQCVTIERRMADWLAGNNGLLRQLSAAPTVNLNELRGEMEVVAKDAVKELSESLDGLSAVVRSGLEKAYADGLVDGASGVAAVRRIHRRPDTSGN